MSESAAARVIIANRALLKIGLPQSYTIDDETEIGGTIDGLWPGVESRAMGLHDWSLMRRTSQPAAIVGDPGNGWQYGFTLPGDRIGDPLAILDQAGRSERYLRSFMLEAGRLYTNVTPVWVRCRVAQDPLYWDRGFAEAFVTALAGELAVPLAQDEQRERDLKIEAWGRPQDDGLGGMFGRLIALDRNAQPQARGFYDDDPLSAARLA